MVVSRRLREYNLQIAARWLFIAGRDPFGPATLTIKSGRVVAVEPGIARNAEDWLDCAVTPGFVNAHCHLDLTGATGACPVKPAQPFPEWLASVIAYRRSRSALEISSDIRAGIAELVATGTRFVGDIAATPESYVQLRADGRLGGVSFWEMIGLSPARATAALDSARDWLDSLDPRGQVRPGLSPHAPYTAGRALLAGANKLAAERGLPVTLHLAESPDETKLLTDRSGAFVPLLQQFNAFTDAEFAADFASAAGALLDAPQLLLAHGNFVRPDDIPPGASVVCCPRTHAAFGWPRHPVAELIAAGVPVCLGTDGRSSNPDLDVLGEARWLYANRSDLSGSTIFSMLTEWGADALGLPDAGRLTVSGPAKIVGVPVDPDEPDPYFALFAPPAALTDAPRRLI